MLFFVCWKKNIIERGLFVGVKSLKIRFINWKYICWNVLFLFGFRLGNNLYVFLNIKMFFKIILLFYFKFVCFMSLFIVGRNCG